MKQKTNYFIIILSTILFLSQSCELKEIKKEEERIIVPATIIGGESEYSSTIKLKFKTKEGIEKIVEKNITLQEFNSVFLDYEIMIAYLPSNPSNLIPIILDTDVKNYLGIENRDIVLNDLYTILEIQEKDSISKFINKISYKWDYFETIDMDSWENIKKSAVISSSPYYVQYTTDDILFSRNFIDTLKQNNYYKIFKDSTGVEVYMNEKYKVHYKPSFEDLKFISSFFIEKITEQSQIEE